MALDIVICSRISIVVKKAMVMKDTTWSAFVATLALVGSTITAVVEIHDCQKVQSLDRMKCISPMAQASSRERGITSERLDRLPAKCL